jgi:uncharacterized caspase-like protein
MARRALLIGVSEFADKRLARLNAPANDVIALREILQDGSRGGFDAVELSLNEDFVGMRDHLSHFFHERAPDDLLLLYYSGHGILGRGNRLFLATIGSDLDSPRDRSLSRTAAPNARSSSWTAATAGRLPSMPRLPPLRRR